MSSLRAVNQSKKETRDVLKPSANQQGVEGVHLMICVCVCVSVCLSVFACNEGVDRCT